MCNTGNQLTKWCHFFRIYQLQLSFFQLIKGRFQIFDIFCVLLIKFGSDNCVTQLRRNGIKNFNFFIQFTFLITQKNNYTNHFLQMKYRNNNSQNRLFKRFCANIFHQRITYWNFTGIQILHRKRIKWNFCTFWNIIFTINLFNTKTKVFWWGVISFETPKHYCKLSQAGIQNHRNIHRCSYNVWNLIN